jgi:hypothetical protein
VEITILLGSDKQNKGTRHVDVFIILATDSTLGLETKMVLDMETAFGQNVS